MRRGSRPGSPSVGTRASRACLDHELRGRQPLILYASGPHFRQTNTIEGELGEGTGGVTEAAKRRIVLPFAGPIEATDHVLGHELVHAFQYDITNTNAQSGAMSALTLPLVVHRRAWRSTCRSVRSIRTRRCGCGRPPGARSCRRSRISRTRRYFPYRYGQALWAFIGGQVRRSRRRRPPAGGDRPVRLRRRVQADSRRGREGARRPSGTRLSSPPIVRSRRRPRCRRRLRRR